MVLWPIVFYWFAIWLVLGFNSVQDAFIFLAMALMLNLVYVLGCNLTRPSVRGPRGPGTAQRTGASEPPVAGLAEAGSSGAAAQDAQAVEPPTVPPGTFLSLLSSLGCRREP